MKYENIFDLIGNSPLVKSNYLSKKYQSNVYLKLEKYNFTNSSKDRIVKKILLENIKNKVINKHTIIIEATSGNTGISLAAICASLKLKCIIVMPENTNIERMNLIKLYNAKVVFTDKTKGMKGSIKKAKSINKKIRNSYLFSQFENILNINAHYETTGKEIIDDFPLIDTFICSCGTSGSIIGISKALKNYNKNIETILVKPKSTCHKIIGVSSNIKPKIFNEKYIDKIIRVEDVITFNTLNKIAENDGIGLGLSSCLSIAGAMNYLKSNKYKNVVILCSDGIERYLSSNVIFNDRFDVSKDIDKMKNIIFSKKFIYDDIFIKYRLSYHQVIQIKSKTLLDAKYIYENDPSCQSVNQVVNDYLAFYAIFSYRLANVIYYNNKPILARKISEFALSKTNIDIHPACKIGVPFSIDHGCNIVIGQTCTIGNNVRLYQNVTLGAKSLSNASSLRNKKRHPTIKNNVIIYSGATILGADTIIGNNVVIGSNVMITKSVKDNMIVISKTNNIIKENKKEDT